MKETHSKCFSNEKYIKYIDSLKNNNYFGENPLLLFLLLIYCTEPSPHWDLLRGMACTSTLGTRLEIDIDIGIVLIDI